MRTTQVIVSVLVEIETTEDEPVLKTVQEAAEKYVENCLETAPHPDRGLPAGMDVLQPVLNASCIYSQSPIVADKTSEKQTALVPVSGGSQSEDNGNELHLG